MLIINRFLNLIIPQSETGLMKLAKGNYGYSSFSKGDMLDFEIEYSLSKLLEKEVEFVKYLDTMLREITLRKDFSPFEIFRTIDQVGLNQLSVEK